MVKTIAITMLFFLSFVSYAQVNELIPKSVFARKALQWGGQNIQVVDLPVRTSEGTIYSRFSLLEKTLKILSESRLSGYANYYILSEMINALQNRTRDERELIRSTVNSIGLSLKDREKLLGHIDSEVENNFNIESNFKVMSFKKNTPSVRIIFKELKESISQLKILSNKNKEKILGAIDLSQKILIGTLNGEDDCYDNDITCQGESNYGIINFNSKKVQNNHKLFLSSFKFKADIIKLGSVVESLPYYDAPLPKYDIWLYALKAAENDPYLALEVLTLYGHDSCAEYAYLSNTKNGLSFIPASLNAIFEIGDFGGCGDEKNFMPTHIQGALSGIYPSSRVSIKLKDVIQEYNRVFGKKFNLRTGYHHVYGGLLIAQEILRENLGKVSFINQATFISQALGYVYKRMQLPSYLSKNKAIDLFEMMNHDEFRSIPLKPKEWSEQEYKEAVATLKLNLAILDYTEEQHLQGAKFAFEVYKKYLSRGLNPLPHKSQTSKN